MLRTSHKVSIVELKKLKDIFQLLSDTTRLKIMFHLMDGERNVGWLSNELKLPQPTLSHHLALLRSANLITSRRAGKCIFYSITFDSNDNRSMFSLIAENWTIGVNNSCPVDESSMEMLSSASSDSGNANHTPY